MNSDLSLDFLSVVEQAAIACAHTMGQGDRHHSDLVAVEAMRQSMDAVPMSLVLYHSTHHSPASSRCVM